LIPEYRVLYYHVSMLHQGLAASSADYMIYLIKRINLQFKLHVSANLCKGLE